MISLRSQPRTRHTRRHISSPHPVTYPAIEAWEVSDIVVFVFNTRYSSQNQVGCVYALATSPQHEALVQFGCFVSILIPRCWPRSIEALEPLDTQPHS